MSSNPARPVIPLVRLIGTVAAALVFAAGVQLFVLTERTDRYFAWTVLPPVTAATLGAFYWTSLVVLLVGLRERAWARVRVAYPGVFAFTALTMVATFLHLGKFHLDADDPVTVFATWAWIVVYSVVPPALLVGLILQGRTRGEEPPRSVPLGTPIRVVLGAIALLSVGTGVALFVAPDSVAPAWPWELTPLTARAVGAWLVGLGLVVATAPWEDDWARLRPVAASGVALLVLEGVVLARYGDQVDWKSPGAWLFVGSIAVLAALSAYGLTRIRSTGTSDGR